jgi:HD-GYP domain-containing protein (c-di-GMP phosphodiesterase class II)
MAFLGLHKLACDRVGTSADVEQLLINNSYQYIFVDILVELSLSEVQLKKAGVVNILYSPSQSVIQEIVKQIQSESLESETKDNNFTRINIEDFFVEHVAALDFHLRIGTNKYIKIVNMGESTPTEQIKKYAENGTQHLYFLNKHRSGFVSTQNEVTHKLLEREVIDGEKILKSLKVTTDKYIDEIYTKGIRPELIQEGKNLCHNVWNFVQKEKSLQKILSDLETFNPEAYSHSFMVCFFSTIICKNLSWAGNKTMEALALGAMFHDIGLLYIDEEVVRKDFDTYTEGELTIFKLHPRKGLESLSGVPGINDSIQQIILQHHETSNGSGFPSGLTSNNIFPLAKIVGLADSFADFLVNRGVSPLAGLKEFLGQRDNSLKYDADLVKNLVNGFTKIDR